MITIHTQRDIFGYYKDILFHDNKIIRELNADNIEIHFNNVFIMSKHHVMEMIDKMKNHRIKSFEYFVPGSEFEANKRAKSKAAFNEIDNFLKLMNASRNFIALGQLFDQCKLQLLFVAPHKNSRFHKSYFKNLSDMENFLQRELQEFKSFKNSLKEVNISR